MHSLHRVNEPCYELMEHNPYWPETIANMIRLTKAGGLVVAICATTRHPERGTIPTSPGNSLLSIGIGWDYHRNRTARDFRRLVALRDRLSKFRICSNRQLADLYFIGFGSCAPAPRCAGVRVAHLHRHDPIPRWQHAKGWSWAQLLAMLVGKERYQRERSWDKQYSDGRWYRP